MIDGLTASVRAPAVDGAGIEARGVRRSFGDVEAVRGIDLTARRGEVTGLVGPNGAGKTTLLLVLATLLVPDAGDVRVAGFDPVTHPREVRARMGWAPDVFGLYDGLTAREYLELFAAAYRLPAAARSDRAMELLALVHLSEFAQRPVHVLSRGQKQRLGLARALVHRPAVRTIPTPPQWTIHSACGSCLAEPFVFLAYAAPRLPTRIDPVTFERVSEPLDPLHSIAQAVPDTPAARPRSRGLATAAATTPPPHRPRPSPRPPQAFSAEPLPPQPFTQTAAPWPPTKPGPWLCGRLPRFRPVGRAGRLWLTARPLHASGPRARARGAGDLTAWVACRRSFQSTSSPPRIPATSNATPVASTMKPKTTGRARRTINGPTLKFRRFTTTMAPPRAMNTPANQPSPSVL